MRLAPVAILLALLGGVPTATIAGTAPDRADIAALPLHSAPPPDRAVLREASVSRGSGPALFAVTLPLSVDLQDGVWDLPTPDRLRWRTRVHSVGARSLLLVFSQFRLPEAAELLVYDVGGRVVQGPYTAADHKADGGLWTAMVPGEMAVIELRVAPHVRDQVRLSLARIGYGYRNAAQLGEAEPCELDAVCPVGDGWGNEIDATVKLQIPVTFGLFVGLCTGTLVNNTAQDDRPFVLTADHCGIGDLGSPASDVVVYWNFQNSRCGIDDATGAVSQTGATLRASDAGTDLSLIELDRAPRSDAQVFYAGWDASGRGGNSGISVHHPAGDAKKISDFTLPLTAVDVRIDTLGPQIPAWRVERWQQGATEAGSSGAGLWNERRQVVGVLSGGRSACSGSAPNAQPDFYARLDRQWLAQTQPAGQLKAWLDPVNGGCLAIGGKRPGRRDAVTCNDDGAPASGGGGGGAVSWLLLVALGAAAGGRRGRGAQRSD